MRKLALVLVATTLAVPASAGSAAWAQSAKPSSKVAFGKVPADAVMSSNLIGLNATNGAKEDVGEIKDIVIDHGRLAGYVLSVGGFLGMGEHYVEVQPTSVAVTYDAADKKWKAMVNTTKEELKAAPEYKYDGRVKQ